MYDFAVIGGGIVGLSAAMHLLARFPDSKLILLEKEDRVAAHQTGHNSGVIHSGIYYKPGSLKAKMAVAGNRSMIAFCREHEIPYDECGKLIVATGQGELPQLQALAERAAQNGIPAQVLDSVQAQEIEPAVACIAAVRIASTGITDYKRVSELMLKIVEGRGGEVRFGNEVRSIVSRTDACAIDDDVEAKFVVACAGLQSDRLARIEGIDPQAAIVPFRGEYYEFVPEKRSLVRNLIYPVPNPDFPFLGVHFTRMIDGSVHAGPNAVLALAREGYRKFDFSARDLAEVLRFAGFWRLAGRNVREGSKEIARSLSKFLFVRSLQKMIPAITSDDVVPAGSGIRAQALRRDGALVDDFLFVHGRRSLHVCNAPSPAATASLEIGRAIVEEVAARR